MSHLLLVRHALPVIDPTSPSERWALSDEGRQATASMVKALTSYAPARLLCGAEPKMIGTAEVLSAAFDLPIVSLAGLSEHARRSMKFGDKTEFEAAIRDLFARPDEIVYGEESAAMTYGRFADALDGELAQESATVIAVSGGTAISIFLARRSGVDAFVTWKGLRLPMAFVLDRKTWEILAEI